MNSNLEKIMTTDNCKCNCKTSKCCKEKTCSCCKEKCCCKN